MKSYQKYLFKWSNKFYSDTEHSYKYKIAERKRLIKLYPEMKQLIKDVQLRDEEQIYECAVTEDIFLGNCELPKPDYSNEKQLYGYGNASYLQELKEDPEMNLESVDDDPSDNDDFVAPENQEISKAPGLAIDHRKELPPTTLTNIHSWFPTWVDGVCRVVGQIPASSDSSKAVITGAILSYSEDNQTFSTLERQYKFSENIDKKSLAKYLKIDHDFSLDIHCSLRQENWLKNVAKISLQSEYEYFKFSRASFNKFLSKDRKKHLSGVLFEKKLATTRSNLMRSVKSADYDSICEELENLLKIVESDGDWLKSFQCLLKKCGQEQDLVHNLKSMESSYRPSRQIDLDETYESLNYENFTVGEKFNSTFTNVEAKLTLWSIVKDEKGRFCITGQRLVDYKRKFCEIKPTPITTVINEGRVVVADRCCYELLGPLYALPIRIAYPHSLNTDFLWPFLSHFMEGVPRNWKIYISMIDILAKCSLLSYVPRNISAQNLSKFNLSEKTIINHSPSFIPSTSFLSPKSKDPSDNKENKRNYRISKKPNSTIISTALRENHNNNEDVYIFNENDKSICQKVSNMTNVFFSFDKSENISTDRKSILKTRSVIKSVDALRPLDTNSLIEKPYDVTVGVNALPVHIDSLTLAESKIENDKDYVTRLFQKGDTEHKINSQSLTSKKNRSQTSKSKSNFFSKEDKKTSATKVKKRYKKDEKVNNLNKVASEDFQFSAQYIGDLDPPQLIDKAASIFVDIDHCQSQPIPSRKRKSQQLLDETCSKKNNSENVEETKKIPKEKSVGNEKKKLKSVLNVNNGDVEKMKKSQRKSIVHVKPSCSSVSKVLFNGNQDTSHQTVGKKRSLLSESATVKNSQLSIINSNRIESDRYFHANNFLSKTTITRSGRKSIPPIDPRSEIERLNEGGKAYLVSNGLKFELLPNQKP